MFSLPRYFLSSPCTSLSSLPLLLHLNQNRNKKLFCNRFSTLFVCPKPKMPTSICNSFSFQSGKRKAPTTPQNPNPKLRLTDFSSQLSNQLSFLSGKAKQTEFFPLDLIEEILARLGVKSLVRFKSVSKQWLFLLSGQEFVNKHLKIKTCMPNRQDFIVQGPKDTNFFIATLYEDRILFQPLETNFIVQPSEIFYGVIGHCNGLVCLHYYCKETDRSSLIIWNPSTKEQKRFPRPECRQGIPASFGFGYHSGSDDYKIVVVLTAVNQPVKVQCLSLKAGSWKTGRCNIPYIFTLYPIVQHINGCIYWLINRGRRLCCGVASFDLGTETLREEESLGWLLSNTNRIYVSLELAGESLCLVDSKDHVTFNVWLMKEDELTQTKSWIQVFTISSTDDNFSKPLNIKWDRIVPVCFIRNGKVVIYSIERQEYVLYDPNDQSFKRLLEIGNPSSNPTSPFVESLVSPQ